MTFGWKKQASSSGNGPSPATPRRTRRMNFSWDALEDRKVMSHGGGLHHLHAAAAPATVQVTPATTTGTTTGTTSTETESAEDTARQTLQKDVQAILSASGTTVGQLTTIRTSSQTLRTDGLTPTSRSALATFENSLVTTLASGTAVTGNAALLAQFKALYTASPTTQQATDLTTAYNALAAAVTSAGVTSANITTINTDYAAVLAAEGSTSTATYPYFSLVTGGHGRGEGGFEGGRGGFDGGRGGFEGGRGD